MGSSKIRKSAAKTNTEKIRSTTTFDETYGHFWRLLRGKNLRKSTSKPRDGAIDFSPCRGCRDCNHRCLRHTRTRGCCTARSRLLLLLPPGCSPGSSHPQTSDRYFTPGAAGTGFPRCWVRVTPPGRPVQLYIPLSRAQSPLRCTANPPLRLHHRILEFPFRGHASDAVRLPGKRTAPPSRGIGCKGRSRVA